MQILAILHLFKHELDSWGDVGSKDGVCLVFEGANITDEKTIYGSFNRGDANTHHQWAKISQQACLNRGYHYSDCSTSGHLYLFNTE